ncbi:T-box transcription factor TBX22 isoform X2 [Anomaloglossus baeobatrachus]|uniref:T-box transcription factor TBX22 isoform X2 n=1 Tax=Anomaloglossus baeobatrachus TaxID=238106 RepID=UPI003F5094E6
MALSSRAHAFSVEALMGAKRKTQEEEERGGRHQDKAEKRPKSAASPSPEPATSKDSGVQVELQGGDLWRRFHQIGTEMIITKAGRRMFPSVRIKVKGLDPTKQYYIALDVVPVDSKRYRYVYHSSQWMVAGNTDHSCISPRLYVHPDSPCSGETWMRQIISFDRVKLTNNEMDDKGHIILQSMHKYKPRVHVIVQDSRFDLSQIQSLPADGVKTFSFKETEFTTVTAYQNQQITKLKIDRNPFAKGFRDPGRNRGVLDGLLENYPWRSLSLECKAFGADTAGGSSGSSPLTSSGGAPSPLLSPSCSPPAFHLPAGSLHCSDTYLHNMGAPFCYRICPSGFLRPRSLLDKPAAAPGGHILSPLMVDVPFLSTFGISRHNKLETLKGPSAPGAAASSPMLYGIPTSGTIFPLAQEALNCSLHPPYGLYGYNFSVPSHLITAAGNIKMTDTCPSSFRDVRAGASRWTPSSVNHCL